jgi:hypothetical protein
MARQLGQVVGSGTISEMDRCISRCRALQPERSIGSTHAKLNDDLTIISVAAIFG